MAVKKSTKKPAKAKKTVPKLKRMSVEELAAVVAEIDAKMAENHAKTEIAMAENHAKTEAVINAAIDRLTIQNQKTSEEVQKLTKNLNDSFGGISRRLGKLTELVVVPKLRHNMNEQGHNFDHAEPDTLIRGVFGGRKEDIAQVDMFLYGPTEAMAVEIKSRLKESAVRVHLERLNDLRDHEEEAGIKGKKLFGAVAGVVIDEFARKVAKENGLYIVEIHEEEEKLNIEKPEQCRMW